MWLCWDEPVSQHIAFLLGKPPKPGTIVADVVTLLQRQQIGCDILLPHEQQISPEQVGGADLVVHRGLSGQDDALLARLAAAGVPLCNPWSGEPRLRNRAAVHAAIRVAAVPSPDGVVRQTWAEVLADDAERRIVVKAIAGAGRGRGVLAGPLPAEPPMPGPYLVENRIDHDGTDRKLYLAGAWVRGLLKPSTLLHEHTTRGQPFDVDPDLAEMARRTATALRLHLTGVDVVLGSDGPVVVDVNAFPGFRGVEGAAEAVAEHLRSHLADRPVS